MMRCECDREGRAVVSRKRRLICRSVSRCRTRRESQRRDQETRDCRKSERELVSTGLGRMQISMGLQGGGQSSVASQGQRAAVAAYEGDSSPGAPSCEQTQTWTQTLVS